MFSVENSDKGPPLTKSQKRRKRCRNCTFSLGLWLLFGLAVSKIIMGAEFGCSLDNKVIIYLVISGGVILLITVLFIAFIIAFGADVIFSKKMKKMMRVPIIVCLIHLPWLIVGSVWGFRNLKDVLDGCEGDCCDKVLVFFATSTIVIDWILTIVTIISIHYLDISRKKIMSLFFDEPPTFVDVGTQHEPTEDEDEKIIKEKPKFDDLIKMDETEDTHIITGKRVKGVSSIQDNVTSDVINTPIETFKTDSPRSPPQANREPSQTAVSYNKSVHPMLDNLPNLAEPTDEIKCDLLPTGPIVEASAKKTKSDSKTSGKNKSKSKKNKKT